MNCEERGGAMPLKVVLLICGLAGECSDTTATSRFTIPVGNVTPMQCFLVGFQELSKMDVWDPKTQRVIVGCRR